MISPSWPVKIICSQRDFPILVKLMAHHLSHSSSKFKLMSISNAHLSKLFDQNFVIL